MTTITAANAADEIERRLNELCACCALFPEVKVEPRAWAELMTYVPREAIEGKTQRRILDLERRVGEMGAKIALFMTWMESLEEGARQILIGAHDVEDQKP